MKYYAQFYQFSTGYVAGTVPPVFDPKARELIPACGDRALINLDGRLTSENMQHIAADECKRRGFIAYRMLRGPALRDAQHNGPIVRVDHLTDLQTVSARP